MRITTSYVNVTKTMRIVVYINGNNKRSYNMANAVSNLKQYLGSIVPSIESTSSGSKVLLDLMFRDNCLLVQDLGTVTGLASSGLPGASIGATVLDMMPVPLLGFQFDTPDNIELLKYSYSEYTSAGNYTVANSVIKKPRTISIKAYRPITAGNNIIANTITNQSIIAALEMYCDLGGRFRILTGWGTISDLSLVDMKGIRVDKELGGVGFQFTLTKYLNTQLDTTSKVLKTVSRLIYG